MHTIAIDSKVLIQEVPYLSMIDNQRYTWEELGQALNLEVQGFGPRNSASQSSTMHLGYMKLPKDLWEAVKRELFALFCTSDGKYTTIRKKFKDNKQTTTIYLLTTITAWLSGLIGVAPAMLTPLVATALYGMAQIGQNAWCNVMQERIKP